MKFLNLVFLTLFTLTFLACGSDTADQSQTPETAPMEGAPAMTAPSASGTPLNAAGGEVKLNPAHGEPGHRCEIAVGAPLDGSAAAPAATQSPLIQTEIPAVTSPIQATPAAPATPVAEGMNPAHGQPGHRCDIAVGAPLSGAPKQ